MSLNIIEKKVNNLEKKIKCANCEIEELKSLVLPGGTSPIIVDQGYNLISTGLEINPLSFSYSSYSNIIGYQAGVNSNTITNSNFIGYQAGIDSQNLLDSNFIGTKAGKDSNYSGTFFTFNSNFIGNETGENANGVTGSNFIGYQAGKNSYNIIYSNFIGNQAGLYNNVVTSSNFIGTEAGHSSNSDYSNLIGFQTGKAFFSNNIGNNNIIIGTNISLPNNRANAINIGGVLFGTDTHSNISGNPSITPSTNGKIGILSVSPAATLDVNGDVIISGSNRYLNFGNTNGQTGYGIRDNAGTLEWKNSVGAWAAFSTGGGGGGGGTSPIIVHNLTSLFSTGLQEPAGLNAVNIDNSNFIGRAVGQSSNTISYSNFIGIYVGSFAQNITFSNFIGNFAGSGAINGSHSNFIGDSAGVDSTDATYSNFIGLSAGYSTTNASYSNFIGYSAGALLEGSNNIIIGTNISLPNLTSNAINIGGVLFGTGTNSDTEAYSPITTATSNGRIGIGVVVPTAVLHLRASTTLNAALRLTVGPAPTSPNDGDIWLESNTTTGLKIRIAGVTRTITMT